MNLFFFFFFFLNYIYCLKSTRRLIDRSSVPYKCSYILYVKQPEQGLYSTIRGKVLTRGSSRLAPTIKDNRFLGRVTGHYGALSSPLLRGCGTGAVNLRRGSLTSPPDRGGGLDYILAQAA